MVTRVVVLDSGPLGLVSNPKRSAENLACNKWLQALLASGIRVVIPEIADYEVRRELLRAKRVKGIVGLDRLARVLDYLPITTVAMRSAADLWAQARQTGQPTAGNRAIDGDVILAAQALSLGIASVVVATTNVGHLARFVQADAWRNIPTQ